LVTQKDLFSLVKRMNFIWLLLSLGSFVSAAVTTTIVDYDGGPATGGAWITLRLHGDPSQLLTLQHVTWCKSFVPNDQSPPELAPDCGGRNVMRLQLFPGAEEVVLKELPSSESSASGSSSSSTDSNNDNAQRFYIDPARVGGWDTRHQWNIYVEMSQRNGGTYRECIRFNALTPAPPPPLVGTTTLSDMATTSTTDKMTVNGDRVTPPPSQPIVILSAEKIVHSWKGAIIVLSVGSFLIFGLVGIAKFLQPRPGASLSLAAQRSQMQSRVYGGASYPFHHQQQDIEMTDFSQDDDEHRLQEEDLQILEMIK
jgi:hypothetical protein